MVIRDPFVEVVEEARAGRPVRRCASAGRIGIAEFTIPVPEDIPPRSTMSKCDSTFSQLPHLRGMIPRREVLVAPFLWRRTSERNLLQWLLTLVCAPMTAPERFIPSPCVSSSMNDRRHRCREWPLHGGRQAH